MKPDAAASVDRHLFQVGFEDPVLVVGLARSGTSWLGKILDSDPRVLYRYEPENLEKCELFRTFAESFEQSGQSKEAERQFRAAFRKVPYLKDHHTAGRHARFKKARLDLSLLSLAEVFPFLDRDAFVRFVFARRRIKLVVKMVEFDWGLKWMANALNYPKLIFIIRHPCANVHSYQSGKAYGMGQLTVAEWANVWRKVHEDIGLPDCVDIPNFKLVVYEQLCERPLEVTKDIFDFLGWKVTKATSQFVTRSTTNEQPGYWSVHKNPIHAAYKWKSDFPKRDVEKVYDVVGNSALMRLWRSEN